jgi:MFS family permease
LFGASMSWMLWDIAFYGNKLFQSTFLMALTGYNTTLVQFQAAAFVNATVALLGYFGAAFLVDHPHVGRLRMQQVGFLITGTLFLTCGFSFNQLSTNWLITMYLASSFFGQLGPNATTFLIPAEIFPTEMRTLCHGICAASGKLGALFAAILFHHVSDVEMFLISGYASFAACAITFWTLPETTGLDLYELDRKWRMTLDGRKQDYQGDANHPNYLSFYERKKRGIPW